MSQQQQQQHMLQSHFLYPGYNGYEMGHQQAGYLHQQAGGYQGYHHYPQQQQQQPLCYNGRPVVETKYMLTRNGPLGTSSQASAAATFFAKNHRAAAAAAAQHVPHLLHPAGGERHPSESSEDRDAGLRTNFRVVVSKAPPPIPPSLSKRIECGEVSGLGKVRVILRVATSHPIDEERNKFFGLDKKKRQVTLLDPSVARTGEIDMEDRKVGVAAPKMFAFDGVFTNEDSQEDVASAALCDVIAAVVNGKDGCLFCFGHANLGKTYTMMGADTCASSVGVIPTAIAWLYRSIKERKQRTGARFSVRVSAVEITNQKEQIRDLLARYASESDQSPGVYLRHLPASHGYALQNLSEVRASSVEKAAFYLDAALSNRTVDSNGRESHFLYTLYVYQYSVDKTGKGGVVGGRSRLHLIDFGGCERTRVPGGGITLSGLGNVILGIFNGQKHLPCRDSKVTQVLRECLGSLTCHATMLAHVSPEPSHYSETLHTIQLASRVHRMRRKRLKAGSSGGSGSSDELRRVTKLKSHDGHSRSGSSTSDFTTSTDPSSSELSCDTVVYRGHSDGSGTDSEHPPVFLPSLNSRDNRGLLSKALRGSAEEISRPRRRSGSKILTNGAISPAGRQSMSPQPHSMSPVCGQSLSNQLSKMSSSEFPRSPGRLTPTLPVIQELNTSSPHARMPLNGRVPGYRQPSETWIDVPRPASADRQQTKEIWVDGKVQQQQQQHGRSYGYMDDFKANMISHWVENQSCRDDQEPLYLTQFKQAESDSGSDRQEPVTKAQVHADSCTPAAEVNTSSQSAAGQQEAGRKAAPPPPPPRKTAPRVEKANDTPDGKDDHLSPRGEVEGSDSPEPLVEPGSLDDIFIQCERLVNSLSRENSSSSAGGSPVKVSRSETGGVAAVEAAVEVQDRGNVPVMDSCCQATEQDIEVSLGSGGPKLAGGTEHPLRILSEENLTVVSTFVADINDLESIEDDAECDPSQFSFFEVPEFCPAGAQEPGQGNDVHYFQTRLKELSKMTAVSAADQKDQPVDKQACDKQEIASSDTKDDKTAGRHSKSLLTAAAADATFSDPRFLYGGSKDVLSTFSQPRVQELAHQTAEVVGHQEAQRPGPADQECCMTPQKQFMLLSQSLRHPDGSSNPDLNLVPPPAKRSPGNGQSSSDQEDEMNLNVTAHSDSINGNQCCQPDNTPDEKPKKKESSNLALKLLRLFGSSRKKNLNSKADEKRSKSCDREIEKAYPKYKEHLLQKDYRSASSSPLKRTDKQKKEKTKSGSKLAAKDKNKKSKSNDVSLDVTGTPSTLSLSTEWEYQVQEDEANGNTNGFQSIEDIHLARSGGFQLYGADLQAATYCEAYFSCLQANNPAGGVVMGVQPTDNGRPPATGEKAQPDRKSSGYDSLEGESSSLDSSHDNSDLLMCNNANNRSKAGEYAVPSDQQDFNEVDRLKMEIRKHPNLLRRAY